MQKKKHKSPKQRFSTKGKNTSFVLTITLLPTICMQWSTENGYGVKKKKTAIILVIRSFNRN